MGVKTEHVIVRLSYSWLPFTVGGRQLNFHEHVQSRLSQLNCSHWGSAVYKWEGVVEKGPHAGKVEVLIGETGDLRQRVNQYVSGTQERENKLWRETFLTLGDIRLFVLGIEDFLVESGSAQTPARTSTLLSSPNTRLILEQILVLHEVSRKEDNLWIVNARQ